MRQSPFFTVVLILIGLALVAVSLPSLGPAVRAARGDGVPGVFTARQVECLRHPGHESCTWWGEFRTRDGRLTHSRVALYGADRETLRAGQETTAIDVGRARQVYGPGGSLEWVFTTLLLLAGLAVIGLAVRGAVRRPSAPRPAGAAMDGAQEERRPTRR